MTSRPLGIAWDKTGWWRRYAEFAESAGIDFEIFEIERSDWIAAINQFQVILWRPNLDSPFCDEAKEKIYFVERFLGRRVIPNWDTFWHYDNKRAQAYLFRLQGIPTPWTMVSYSYPEARAQVSTVQYPVVSKRAGGAASENVRLLSSRTSALREVRRVFHEPLWFKALRRLGMQVRLTPRSQSGYVLWQQFLPANPRDLRITVIGKDRVFAFWRNNRPNDFRASGSGLIDYAIDDVEEECLFCLEICRRNNFDSMAFDLVYHQSRFVILEMSCAFNDEAIYSAPAHFLLVDPDAGRLQRVAGHVWPQELQVNYARRLLAESSPTIP
jgi:glutathione synthase/RimK-type ligase-like ATP-grasp enzyme